MKKQPVWTTKDGRSIPIRELGDSHLRHIIGMLERKASDALWALPRIKMQGELAQACMDTEFDATLQDGIDPGIIWPIYNDLMQENSRRMLLRMGHDIDTLVKNVDAMENPRPPAMIMPKKRLDRFINERVKKEVRRIRRKFDLDLE